MFASLVHFNMVFPQLPHVKLSAFLRVWPGSEMLLPAYLSTKSSIRSNAVRTKSRTVRTSALVLRICLKKLMRAHNGIRLAETMPESRYYFVGKSASKVPL